MNKKATERMNKYSTRTIELSKQLITYKVFRNRRTKNIRLYVNVMGELEVRIPKSVKDDSVSEILAKHSKWVLKHFSRRKVKNDFYFLGNKVELKHSYDLFLTKSQFLLNNNTLHIITPSSSSESSTLLYEIWLKQKAEEYIIPRVEELAANHGFKVNRVTIRRQKTRWGSCSTRGSLSFNSRLMCFDTGVIDYVIIHELCHFKEMNHSQKFWRLVEEIIPDYKKFVLKLRMLSYESFGK